MVSTRLPFFHKQNHRALVLKHTIINLCLKKQERLHCCLHHSTFFWRPQPLACCITYLGYLLTGFMVVLTWGRASKTY